jgi:hypothetical protein
MRLLGDIGCGNADGEPVIIKRSIHKFASIVRTEQNDGLLLAVTIVCGIYLSNTGVLGISVVQFTVIFS